MEANQTQQMVAWLDEERRKDKLLITKLDEKTGAQATLIQDQNRRIQALENEINSLRTAMLSTTMFEEVIARTRAESKNSFDQLEKRRSTAEQDQKRSREMDRETLLKAIDDLRQEMITRIDRAIQPRRTEEERLSRVAVELQDYANSLSKGLEEFERSLAFLEEQRRQDTRRLSEMNGEIADLMKRSDTQQAKLELLEELSRRNERLATELDASLTEFKADRQGRIEQQALADQERERAVNDMLKRIDTFGTEMERHTRQVEGWAETQRQVRQRIEEFERVADRVERRMNEAGEVQRLSEERFRQEWEEAQADDQKRWRQFTITNDEAWRQNEKSLEELKGLLVTLSERAERQSEHIKYLSTMQEKSILQVLDRYQELREEHENGRSSLPSLT